MSELESYHSCWRLLSALCVEDGVAGRYERVILLCRVKGYRIHKAGWLYEVVFDGPLVPQFIDGARVALPKVVSGEDGNGLRSRAFLVTQSDSLCSCLLHGITVELLPPSQATVCSHKYDCHTEALLELVSGRGCKHNALELQAEGLQRVRLIDLKRFVVSWRKAFAPN